MSEQYASFHKDSAKSITDSNDIQQVENAEPSLVLSPLEAFRGFLVNSFSEAEFCDALLFDDNLVDDETDGSGTSGEYRTSVAASIWNGKPCFVVEIFSNGVANGVKWKLQLTATVEIPSLGTVRQKRVFTVESSVENSASDDEPLDVVECLTTVEMLKRPVTPVEEPPPQDDDGEGEDEDEVPKMGGEGEDKEEKTEEPMHVTYRISNTIKHHHDKEEAELLLDEADSAKFFPEGALVILLRCLAKLQFENQPDPLELLDVDPDFQPCPLLCFRDDGARPEDDGDNVDESTNAFRFILEHHRSDDVVYKTTTDHLSSGQLVSRTQEEPFAVFRRKVEKVAEIKSSGIQSTEPSKPEFPKKDLVLEEDSELTSNYEDRKDELKASHASYIREHPELKTIMADFLQEVLTIKPDNFMTFAANYFSGFRQTETSRSRLRSRSKSTRAGSSATRSSKLSEVCACEEPEPEGFSQFDIVGL